MDGDRSPIVGIRGQHLAQVHDTDGFLPVAEYGIAGVRLRHPRAHLGDRGVPGNHRNLAARDHCVLDIPFGEIQDAIQQQRQILRQVAARTRVVDDSLEILRRRAAVEVVDGFHPEHPQHGVRGLVEQGDQPSEDCQIQQRRTREPTGEGLGVRDRQILRKEFTEDHLHDGCEQQGQHRAEGDPHRRWYPGATEQHPERLSDEGFSDEPHEQAGDGDAELCARQHERSATCDGEGPFGRSVALLCPRPQCCPVDGHVGEFLSDEVAVRRDDEDRHHHTGQHEQ